MSFIFFNPSPIQARPLYPQISVISHAPDVLQVSPPILDPSIPFLSLFYSPFLIFFLAVSNSSVKIHLLCESLIVFFFFTHPDRNNYNFVSLYFNVEWTDGSKCIGARKIAFLSWLLCSLWPWAKHLMSLSLKFLISKVGTMSTYQRCCNDCNHVYKMLRPWLHSKNRKGRNFIIILPFIINWLVL